MAKPNIRISAFGGAAGVSGTVRAAVRLFPMLRRELRLLRYPALGSFIATLAAFLIWQVGSWAGNEYIQVFGLWTWALAGLVFAALLGIFLGVLALDGFNLFCGRNPGKPTEGK